MVVTLAVIRVSVTEAEVVEVVEVIVLECEQCMVYQ